MTEKIELVLWAMFAAAWIMFLVGVFIRPPKLPRNDIERIDGDW